MEGFQLDERVKNILNHIHAGVLYCKNDQHSTILYANDYFYTLVGYTKDEVEQLFNNHFADMVIDDVSQILVNVAKTIKQGKNLDFDYRMRRKDGSIIWIHDTAVYDETYNCFYVTIMDITMMKSIEAEREKLNYYLHYIPNKIIISSPEGEILYKNDQALQCGYLDQNATTMHDLISPYVIGADANVIENVILEGKYAKFETRFRKGDTFVGHDKNYALPIYDKHKVLLSHMLVSEDLLEHSDSLTHFPTRAMVEYYFEQLIKNHPPKSLYMCILDIDNFKMINDTYGHLIGDRIIQLTARRLEERMEKEDYCCRFGGDEFIILSVNQTLDTILDKFNQLIELTQQDLNIEDHTLKVSYSIGISEMMNKDISFKALLQKADEALYEAKDNGKGHIMVYDSVCSIK